MNYHNKKVVEDYKCQKSMQLQLYVDKIPNLLWDTPSDLWKVRNYKSPQCFLTNKPWIITKTSFKYAYSSM